MKLPKTLPASRREAIGPSWRSLLAKELVLKNQHIPGCEDIPLRNYVLYLSALEMSGTESTAVTDYPLIASALTIDSDLALVDQLKIMLVGRLDLAEICSRAKLELAALNSWISLFFDFGDDFDTPNWVARHVVRRELDAGRSDFAGKLGLALSGGPDGARLALELETGLPLAKADRLARQELQLGLKISFALAMRISNNDDAYRWSKLHFDNQRGELRLALEKQKFEARCTELRRRHEWRQLQAAQKPATRDQAAKLRKERFAQAQAQIDARAATSPLAQLKWPKAPANASVVDPDRPSVIPFTPLAKHPEPLASVRDGALDPAPGDSSLTPSSLPSAAFTPANSQEPARHSA